MIAPQLGNDFVLRFLIRFIVLGLILRLRWSLASAKSFKVGFVGRNTLIPCQLISKSSRLITLTSKKVSRVFLLFGLVEETISLYVVSRFSTFWARSAFCFLSSEEETILANTISLSEDSGAYQHRRKVSDQYRRRSKQALSKARLEEYEDQLRNMKGMRYACFP
jgi:hypothetical protein